MARRDCPRGRQAHQGEIAAASVEVARVAREGDSVAARVIHRALGEIRAHLEAVLERTAGWTRPAPVALVGGLVRKGSPLREAVVEMAAELGARCGSGRWSRNGEHCVWRGFAGGLSAPDAILAPGLPFWQVFAVQCGAILPFWQGSRGRWQPRPPAFWPGNSHGA